MPPASDTVRPYLLSGVLLAGAYAYGPVLCPGARRRYCRVGGGTIRDMAGYPARILG